MIKREETRNQTKLYFSLEEQIDENNIVRWIDLIVEKLVKKHADRYKDYGAKSTGRPAYSINTMLKLFSYGCLNRIKSSRRLEKECYRNIEVMWLLDEQKPDHKTIANFRRDHGNLIKEFSRDLKQMLKAVVLADNPVVATDGTKLKANASRDMLSQRTVSATLKRLEHELEPYFNKIDELSESESEADIEQLEELKQTVARLQAELARAQADKQLLDKSNLNHLSKTDPDCRLMHGQDGKRPAYNVQMTSDTENHLIVGSEVSQAGNDLNQLLPAQKRLEWGLGMTPSVHIADSGYCNLDVIEAIEAQGQTECYTPVPVDQAKRGIVTFRYDREYDKYICSQGKDLLLKSKNKPTKSSIVNVYVGTSCEDCPLRDECTKSKVGRHISRFWNQDYRDKYRAKSESAIGKRMSTTRKATIEHIFATLKLWCGHIPILTRGLESVKTEIEIFTISWNINRLSKIMSFSDFKQKLANYMGEIPVFLHIFLKNMWFKSSIINFKPNFNLKCG